MTPSSTDRSLPARLGLAAGGLAATAWGAAQLYNRRKRRSLLQPGALLQAVDAPLASMPLPEGCARYYHRDGEGVPLVLLHSINAAGSTHEMAPIFEHFTRTTNRPIYALDWFGFGQSDRVALRYHPALFVRQLHLFLHETVGERADLAALSLGGEYVASVASTHPEVVRRLVLIAPTGCARNEGPSAVGPFFVRAADRAHLFETFFYRLTRASSLRRFYRNEIFPHGSTVPAALVRYASATTHVRGAHHAPRFFVSGNLFLRDAARRAYQRLRCPTLIVTPQATSERLVQSFERLPELLSANPSALQQATVGRGLLPQWEAPEALFDKLAPFLS